MHKNINYKLVGQKLKKSVFALLLHALILILLPCKVSFADDTRHMHPPATPQEADEHGSLNFGGKITSIFHRTTKLSEDYFQQNKLTRNSYSFDLELDYSSSEYDSFFALAEIGKGNGVDELLPTFQTFNADAFDDNKINLTELWYEHNSKNDKYRFKIGRLDFTFDFDTNEYANCEMDQFLSNAFVNNITLEFPDKTKFGAVFQYYLPHDLSLVAGITEKFLIYELCYEGTHNNRAANFHLYRWFNKYDHESILNPIISSENNQGYGFSCDHEINDIIGIFARYGKQSENVSEFDKAWSCGLQYNGKQWGRNNDRIGYAFGKANLSQPYKTDMQDNGFNTANENVHELYYSCQANSHLTFTPFYQCLKNALGDKSAPSVKMLGLRVQANF